MYSESCHGKTDKKIGGRSATKEYYRKDTLVSLYYGKGHVEKEQTYFFYGAAKNRPGQKDKNNTHFGSIRPIFLPIRDKTDHLRTIACLLQARSTNWRSACWAGYKWVPASLPEYSRSLRVALIPQCVQDNQALFPVMHIPGPHSWVPALGLRGATEHAFSVSTHEGAHTRVS